MPIFCSCEIEKRKDAYCFSLVFERENDNAVMSAYCKTHESSLSKTENKKLTFTAEDFRSVFDKVSKGDHNIYFGSICAYYLSNSLTDYDLEVITLILFDHSEFRIDTPLMYDRNISSDDLHIIAENTSKNEQINRSEKWKYSPTISVLRKYY